MTDAHGGVADPVSAREDRPEQARLAVLQIAAQGIGAEIRDLDHAGQLAVDEHGCFDDAVDARPGCSGGVEGPHHADVHAGRGLVVVVHQQPVIALGAGAGATGPQVPEVPLEPGDDLLERLGLGALGSEGRAAWRLSADASRNPVRR